MKLIELDNITFRYEKEEPAVLKDFSLAVAEGSCVIIEGDNGSGKTTLFRILTGLSFPEKGEYSFDGTNITREYMKDNANSKKFHKKIGYLFQSPDVMLFNPRVYDEIAFGPRQMGLGEEEVRRRVDDVCRMIGIDELRGRAPWALSGGEKKKVAIGCILSMNPDAYCFDEPLNGLDARTRAWLLGFLHQLKDAGKTLVIATHDQSLADEVADYFVYMGDFHEYGDRPHVHINQ